MRVENIFSAGYNVKTSKQDRSVCVKYDSGYCTRCVVHVVWSTMLLFEGSDGAEKRHVIHHSPLTRRWKKNKKKKKKRKGEATQWPVGKHTRANAPLVDTRTHTHALE